jgi:hypothetical protein
MGIEYVIINRKNKTFYWLGKGPWLFLELDALVDQEYLEYVLKWEHFQLKDLDSYYYRDLDWLGPILTRMSSELVSFAKDTPVSDLVIVNDTCDWISDARCLHYLCVGSFYPNYEEENWHLMDKNIARYTRDRVYEENLKWFDHQK